MARPAPAASRAVSILAFLAAHPSRGFTISELVHHLGMNIASAHATLAIESRTRLAAEFRRLGFAPAPSAGNFLFVPVARAQAIAEGMCRRGVLVRALSGLPQEMPALAATGGDALRIGVGPWDAMERVLGTFAEALACA